jgi:hypothetical protein
MEATGELIEARNRKNERGMARAEEKLAAIRREKAEVGAAPAPAPSAPCVPMKD